MRDSQDTADQTRTTVHAGLIAKILADNPTARTRGFMAALRKLPDAEYMHELASEYAFWFASVLVIPDAFKVDETTRTVTVYEAVHHHDISPFKFGRFSEIAWAMDEDRWKLKLVRIDRFGATEYDPRDVYIAQKMTGDPSWQAFKSEDLAADPAVAAFIDQLDCRYAEYPA